MDRSSYAPRSPDLSAYHSAPAPPPEQTPYLPPHQALPRQHHTFFEQQPHQQAYVPSNYAGLQNQQAFSSNQISLSPPGGGQPTRDMEFGQPEWTPEMSGERSGRGRKSKKVKVEPDYGSKPAPGVEQGIEVRTKFPVARIKRIMQADEDVGKVAQVTPTAVSKALELFMISLVTKSADQARAKSSKKVTAVHLKQVVEQDEQFDFLADIMAKVPDAPTKKEKEEDSEGTLGEPKRKRAQRKKKAEEDDN